MDFEKEVSEIYPWILRVAKRFCRSMQDAEDLAGDTVYKMLINRDKFDVDRKSTRLNSSHPSSSRMPSSA